MTKTLPFVIFLFFMWHTISVVIASAEKTRVATYGNLHKTAAVREKMTQLPR